METLSLEALGRWVDEALPDSCPERSAVLYLSTAASDAIEASLLPGAPHVPFPDRSRYVRTPKGHVFLMTPAKVAIRTAGQGTEDMSLVTLHWPSAAGVWREAPPKWFALPEAKGEWVDDDVWTEGEKAPSSGLGCVTEYKGPKGEGGGVGLTDAMLGVDMPPWVRTARQAMMDMDRERGLLQEQRIANLIRYDYDFLASRSRAGIEHFLKTNTQGETERKETEMTKWFKVAVTRVDEDGEVTVILPPTDVRADGGAWCSPSEAAQRVALRLADVAKAKDGDPEEIPAQELKIEVAPLFS